MKIDLTDTAFIIPVRIDSIIRLENLLMSLDCILSYFHTQIYILEASSYPNKIIPSLTSKESSITYHFLLDKDPIFHKTKYLNILSKYVNTPIVCIWDADVILDHIQILDAIKQLRTKKFEVAYPYDGDFLDTSDILREHYWLHRDIAFLHPCVIALWSHRIGLKHPVTGEEMTFLKEPPAVFPWTSV